MSTIYSYACRDYPGMSECPGEFRAASREELWKLIELHASAAHGEDPASWSEEDEAQINALIGVDEN